MAAKQVEILEVGPRDGLQNEKQTISSDTKIEFIDRLSASGLKAIEVTSFVSSKKIPNLADNQMIYQKIQKHPDIAYSALVPNERGMQNALAAGVNHIAVFTAVSETFCQKNINCSIAESLTRFAKVITLAKQHKVFVRGYLSCVFGCPYEGKTSIEKTAQLTKVLLDMGCDEIALGDTIGIAGPGEVQAILDKVLEIIKPKQLALHFHDTYGQALTNIYTAYQTGIYKFDSSVSGLGGCPYAKGATGNVATEDVVYLFNSLGVKSGI
ncbi:MAG: hydroxymethylglutaryl-CoA lyase, partial [Pseudomonadota bacterium]